MGGLTYLLQQHFSSFTKLKDPKRLLQYGQYNFPLIQDSFKKIKLFRFVFRARAHAQKTWKKVLYSVSFNI